MGGGASIEFVDDRNETIARDIAQFAQVEARRIELKFSRYRESSVVSEINRGAGRTPVDVDCETDALIESALQLAELTAGRFDPTVGPLRRAWDFSSGRVPSRREVEALMPLVDYRSVLRRDRTVFLRRAGMEIDLGGVGKEYAVDRVADLLRKEGVGQAIVNFAGDVRTLGSRGDGRPWSVGVLDPRDRTRCRFSVRPIAGAGIATSGDYERGFVREGVRYHHILDATTGWPARGVCSATVVASTTSRAGRFCTAALLLGPEAGWNLLEKQAGVEGALITEKGEILATSGMDVLSNLPRSLFAVCPLL
jgi:thiamine biosynthesis lipoprotein